MRANVAYAIGARLGMRKQAQELPDLPNFWEVLRNEGQRATQTGRAKALNDMMRNLVSRAPKGFQQMRGALGGTKAVMKSVYPSLLKMLKRI